MPIYEFRCAACGAVYEELVGVGAGAEARCPRCGRPERSRVPSRFAVTAAPGLTGEGAPRSGAGGCCGGGCGCRATGAEGGR